MYNASHGMVTEQTYRSIGKGFQNFSCFLVTSKLIIIIVIIIIIIINNLIIIIIIIIIIQCQTEEEVEMGAPLGVRPTDEWGPTISSPSLLIG